MPPIPELKVDHSPAACHAPPMTDELIANYTALAEALPDSQGDVRDAMRECLKAVKVWWELPESKGNPKDLKVNVNGRLTIKVVTLTDDLKTKLFDAIPWLYEIKSMQALFDGVQAEETARNAVKVDQWRGEVRDAVYAQELGGRADFVKSEDRKAMRAAVIALGQFPSVADLYLDKVLAAFGETRDSLKVDADACAKADARLTAIENGTEEPPVPKPLLEPTLVRDAAMHLLWFVIELNQDREPLTQDKLK